MRVFVPCAALVGVEPEVLDAALRMNGGSCEDQQDLPPSDYSRFAINSIYLHGQEIGVAMRLSQMDQQYLIISNQSTMPLKASTIFVFYVALVAGADAQQRIVDCSLSPVQCKQVDIKIIDEEWNNTVLRRCRISGERTGIVIRNVQNFTLGSCVIENISKGSGIYFDPMQPSQNVTLTGNTLMHIAKNGIAAPEGSVTQLLVSRNVLVDVATEVWRGLHHGIYVQVPGSRLLENQISKVRDGNGIAIRSSAEISGNEISETGKSGIGYFNDHPAPQSTTLMISGNIISNFGQQASGRAGIEVLTNSPRYPVIHQVIIEDNLVTGDNPIDCHNHPNCTVR